MHSVTCVIPTDSQLATFICEGEKLVPISLLQFERLSIMTCSCSYRGYIPESPSFSFISIFKCRKKNHLDVTICGLPFPCLLAAQLHLQPYSAAYPKSNCAPNTSHFSFRLTINSTVPSQQYLQLQCSQLSVVRNQTQPLLPRLCCKEQLVEGDQLVSILGKWQR